MFPGNAEERGEFEHLLPHGKGSQGDERNHEGGAQGRGADAKQGKEQAGR